MNIFVRTVPAVMQAFGCSSEDAARYCDLRDEGYGAEQAKLMAGLTDPPDPDEPDFDCSPSELHVVLYEHTSGSVVVMGLYQDEADAESALRSLKGDRAVRRAWRTLELVFYAS